MIALISLLVEKSRGDDDKLQISERDYNSLIGGKVSFLKLRVNDSSDLTAGREVSGEMTINYRSQRKIIILL